MTINCMFNQIIPSLGRLSLQNKKGKHCLSLERFTYLYSNFLKLFKRKRGFPGGAVVENLPANAGDTGSSPGLGGSHMPRSD